MNFDFNYKVNRECLDAATRPWTMILREHDLLHDDFPAKRADGGFSFVLYYKKLSLDQHLTLTGYFQDSKPTLFTVMVQDKGCLYQGTDGVAAAEAFNKRCLEEPCFQSISKIGDEAIDRFDQTLKKLED